jgi:hypothetical protein
MSGTLLFTRAPLRLRVRRAGHVLASGLVAALPYLGEVEQVTLRSGSHDGAERLFNAFMFVSNGPFAGASLALLLALVAWRIPRARSVLATVFVFWVLAAMRVAVKGGWWSPFYAFWVTGVLITVLVGTLPFPRLLLLTAVAGAVLLLGRLDWSGEVQRRSPAAGVARPLDERSLWQLQVPWRTLMAMTDTAASVRIEGGLHSRARWAREYLTGRADARSRMLVATYESGPWCETGLAILPCRFAAETTTAGIIGRGPALLQLAAAALFEHPVAAVIELDDCTDGEEHRIPVRGGSVYVNTTLRVMVGVVRIPQDCRNVRVDLPSGDWLLWHSADGDGSRWQARAGSGRRPYRVHRY